MFGGTYFAPVYFGTDYFGTRIQPIIDAIIGPVISFSLCIRKNVVKVLEI